MSRYDWLLFLHVLSAFALVGGVVVFTTVLMGVRGTPAVLRLTPLARRLWDVGGAGTLVLGIWLAIDLDGYDILDGWVVAAIVLWVLAAFAGIRLGTVFQQGRDGGSIAAGRANFFYAIAAVATLALLVDMIYKPGA